MTARKAPAPKKATARKSPAPKKASARKSPAPKKTAARTKKPAPRKTATRTRNTKTTPKTTQKTRTSQHKPTPLESGHPGTRLAQARLGHTTAPGLEGEWRLHHHLHRTGVLHHAAALWSAAAPDPAHLKQGRIAPWNKADIDLILITGLAVWLIDAKHWREGTWTTRPRSGHIHCRNWDGTSNGRPMTPTALMADTRDALARILPIPIEAVAAQTNPAADTTHAWFPGGIPMIPADELAEHIHAEAILAPPDPHVIAMLAPLASDPDAPIIQAAHALVAHDRKHAS